MSIFYTNKTITMNRGDSGVVLLSILNRDDTPFALPIGMKNPTIVFSVKAETDANDLNSNMLIEEYMPVDDYTYYGYGTQNADGQMQIHGGFYPKSKVVNTTESVLDTGVIYKVLENKKYMFVVPTTTPPEYPIDLTKREYAFAVPLVFEPAFTDRLSPGTYTYSITLLDSTSPIRFQQGEGIEQIDVDNYSEFLKNVTLKQDLFGPQKLILSDSPIARVHGDPIRRIYYIKPCSEESVANATASEITTGNITNIALPPVYIATSEQLGGVIVGQTLQVDFRGVLNVSAVITNKIADLYAKIGDLSTLTTDEKTTIVGAINEVDEHADTAQQTADNAAELANSATTKAEQAITTANGATTAANEAKAQAATAVETANSAKETANTANTTANEAKAIAQGSQRAIGFATLQAAITALNGYDNTQLKVGDNVYIVETGVPDLWVTAVEQNSVAYNYTTNDAFNDDLVENTLVQVGYYKFAYLESDGKPCTVAWQNMTVAESDWVSSTEFEDFAYEAKIILTDFVNFSSIPQVVFGLTEATSGNYAPICKAGDKGVYIYSKVNTSITLPTIVTFAPNVHGAAMQGGGYANKGQWVASTSYEINDMVYTDKGQFVCVEAVTSTTSPDKDGTHWQATFVATAGTTKNALKFSGQNGNGTEVQKTFDGSTPVEVAFDETTMTVKEVNGVLEIGARGTIPEALPQEAGALKSGNLPTTGWTLTVENFLNGYTFTQYGKEVTIYSGGYSKYYGKITGWEVLIGDTWHKMNNPHEGGYIFQQYAVYNRTGYTEIVVNPSWGSYAIYYTIKIYPDGHVTGYSSSIYEANINQSFRNTEISEQTYTISDTSITANSDILMELTDDGGVKAYSMEAGKMTVIRDTVPTQPIPYTYKVKQTNASGQFTVLNHFVPSVPESPTSLPVTYKKVSGSLPTTGWESTNVSWTGNVTSSANYDYLKFVTNIAGSYATNEIFYKTTYDNLLKSATVKSTGNGPIGNAGSSAASTQTGDYKLYAEEINAKIHIVIYDNGDIYYSCQEGSGIGSYALTELSVASSRKTYTISDAFITANTSVKMYLTDEGGVTAYGKTNGSITVIRDTVPTTAIPYKYEVEQTSTEGLFEVINAYVPTKTSELTNDSGFVKPTEANTFTGEQTFSNENGIKTNRVHNLDGNAWYDFDGTNDRLGSLATPTIIRTSEARPKAEVPSGSATVTKEIALLEDVPSVGEWVSVTGETATLTQAGTYQVIATVNDMQSIVYWDGSTEAYGTKSTAPMVVTGGVGYLFINCTYPHIDANGTLSVHLITVGHSTGTWTEENTTQSGFKYRKIN